MPCGPTANAAKYLAAEAGFQACEQAVMTHGGFRPLPVLDGGKPVGIVGTSWIASRASHRGLRPPVGWAAVVGLVVTAAYMAFRSGPLQLASYADNPFTPLPSALVDPLGSIGILTMIPVMGSASWSLVLRFHRSTGIEREQIKWLAFSAVPLAVAGLASAVLPDKLGQVVFVFLLLSVPIAVGVAVLRYRLYDINVLINRTLVYGTLSATLIATYVASVILVGAVLRPFTSGSELAVAVSTLATLALVQPLRRRIQNAVNRRFYRSRYDAVRTLDAFSARLRDEVDLDAVRADLIDAVHHTVQPAHASVWLRGQP